MTTFYEILDSQMRTPWRLEREIISPFLHTNDSGKVLKEKHTDEL
jgi:hypothetical protein